MENVFHLSESKHAWENCSFCTNVDFKVQQDFIRHLRDRHCSREGGSYVCRYGYNGVCSSLPVEGVSDEDYEDHVYKHHVFPHQYAIKATRGNLRNLMNHQMSEKPNVVAVEKQWSLYSAAQNLPALLNDPNRGKQRDFFTKTWGDSFVEKIDIPKAHYLPDISHAHFESYLRKIARRYHKHVRMNAVTPKQSPHNELLQHFPRVKAARSLVVIPERGQFDISCIPKIFLQANLDLSHVDTFKAVYQFSKDPQSPVSNDGVRSSQRSEKLLQEKLSHYLDIVEVQIAQQVAQKSEAFFHAMTSHDALMEQLTQTVTVVKALRDKIHHIDNSLVRDSLNILRLERMRRNYLLMHDKIKLMSTVHQTQTMIQSLLSTPDYVAALDLISTTQEILVQELAGVHSFRHLSSQLLEMERLIDKMLSTEFERYATADLNRPLDSDQQILDGDKLVSIIFGMLRQNHFDFIDMYKDEAFTAIKAVMKQMVIEVIAASDTGDSELALTGLGDQLQVLELHDLLHLLENATSTLMCLVHRVKALHDVMRQAADVSAGKTHESNGNSASGSDVPSHIHVPVVLDPPDIFLSAEDHERVIGKLHNLLTSVCDYAHERVAQLLSAPSHAQANEQRDKNNPSQIQVRSGEKQSQAQNTASHSSYWLVDKAAASQICDLAHVIDDFTEQCEKVSGKTSTALRSVFKVQASKFVQRFHQDRKTKLSLILDSERWKQADVPAEFQRLVTHISDTGKFMQTKRETDSEIDDRKPSDVLIVGEEKYAVVGTVLLLLKMVAEYCVCATDLSVMAPNLCRHLAELLQLFNSRCCQLVLGAGALHVAGLKTITTTNLALASRALQLLLWLVPHVRDHFQEMFETHQTQQLPYRNISGVNHFDGVEKDVNSHVHEIESKVLSIISNLITMQLNQWDARPPVPSQAFRNISRHLTKLHEAVSNILPETQVQDLYRTVNKTFKDKLRDQLMKMNVVNNGGPQHGIVTSELTFYLTTLKTLHALPLDELADNAMDDIWISR
ncbi:Vacuolar protein sorting-associated protein 54 [Cryptotermes secundus]|uniref:Vacuolar protein sorting-associated protein 54 n=1 Tax=Cryptotermes secundus TaxID=105785 RepID=A0A2J7QXU0_9NEOP|nr:vacuolar protein sorting-associated protein 54 isoform X1 [Cryptotermes secundus]PNF33403.1 Vacuolar protein sorting-associated protein 54 [Cryptotermes secundus]